MDDVDRQLRRDLVKVVSSRMSLFIQLRVIVTEPQDDPVLLCRLGGSILLQLGNNAGNVCDCIIRRSQKVGGCRL